MKYNIKIEKIYMNAFIVEKLDITLYDLIYFHPNLFLNFLFKLNIMKQIALGIQTLHDHQISHGDLSCTNIMLKIVDKDKYVAKIIDFDSLFDHSKDVISYNIKGTIPYMAPELGGGYTINCKTKYTFECDIYSCGIIFAMILGGKSLLFSKKPVDDLKTIDFVEIETLIRDMCAIEPKNRPPISEVLRLLTFLGNDDFVPIVPDTKKEK